MIFWEEPWEDGRGFTLVEVMVTIILMGIVFAIASSTWFGVVESRRVDSATNQIASDLRLANATATNRLSSAYIVFNRGGSAVSCNSTQADYCLVEPTRATADAPVVLQAKARYLPDSDYSASPPKRSVKLVSSNASLDPTSVVDPFTGLAISIPGVVGGTTSTVEFKADGSANMLGAVVAAPLLTARTFGDSAITQSCAAAHTNPCHDVEITPSTSRVKIVY